MVAGCLPLEDINLMADNEKQVSWGGRFSHKPDDLMQIFGESISFDQRLAPYDLQCSLGHASMLAHVGLLDGNEFKEIKKGIAELSEEILGDDFPWKLELEDVHMNLEQALRKKPRPPTSFMQDEVGTIKLRPICACFSKMHAIKSKRPWNVP